MKPVFKLAVFILITGAFVHIACKKEYSCENCKGNKPPIANAGPDQVITLPTDSVSLDGSSSSDPDGSISGYLWKKISGPASFIIANASGVKTVVKNLAAGSYQFELKVTDNGGLSAKDTMRVTVDSVLTANHAPIANAGPDQTITLPVDTVTLNGAASFDPDNNISTYAWTKISGPSSFNISNANFVQTSVANLVQGVYQFELKVTDAGGLFSKDTMHVTVNIASNNLAPVARAGNDTTIQSSQTSCTPVSVSITLNGSASYDPDGTIVSYLWTGPGVITNPNAAITTVNGFFQGTALFILKVTDNVGAFAFDTVNILIVPANRTLVQAQLIPIGTLSETRNGIAVAAAGNKIVFAGGWPINGTMPASAKVDIYDVITTQWTTAQLSEGRFGIGVAVLGNKIYLGGGGVLTLNSLGGYEYLSSNNGSSNSSKVDIYDASVNTWSSSQMSSPHSPTGASAGNKIVFAGGDNLNPSSRVDIYDLISNSWSTSELSDVKHVPQAAKWGNKIFFSGGSRDFNAWGGPIYKSIDIYDASSNTWSIDSLSFDRGEMGSIGANNKIFWGGGFVNNGAFDETNSVEIKDLVNNTTSFNCLSEPKGGITAARKDNKIIFYGGYGKNKFDIYDLNTDTWSIGVLPSNILSLGNIISYNNILYVSGLIINGEWSNQVFKLDF